MCVNTHFILNPYDGHSYLVNCGHCEACLQQKVNRHKERIDFEFKASSSLPVFVTLSYENAYIPYILEDDLHSYIHNPHSYLPVYRGGHIITSYSFDDLKARDGKLDMYGWDKPLPFLRYRLNCGRYSVLSGKVGVLFLDDVQKFVKRLKVNLSRSCYKGYFSYYYASEYGEKYQRPHFHFLFFIDKGYYQKFRCLIDKSWKYADLLKRRRQGDGTYRDSIELAKNPSKYLSSYLNCNSYVSPFLLSCKKFKPFRHFSTHFGVFSRDFALPTLQAKILAGNLYFNREISSHGVSTVYEFRIPKYVLSIYFPKFKGYRLLSSSEIIDFVERPIKFFFDQRFYCRYSDREIEDIYNFVLRLKSRPYYCYDWLLCYSRLWTLFSSCSIRDSYKDVLSVSDLFQHYDNIKAYYLGDVQNRFLFDCDLPSVQYFDPNDFPARIYKTNVLMSKFKSNVKHHRLKSSYYEKPDF